MPTLSSQYASSLGIGPKFAAWPAVVISIVRSTHVHLSSPSSGRSAAARRIFLLFLLLSSLGAAQANERAAQPNEAHKVLIVMQEDTSWPVFRLIDENLRTTLLQGTPGVLIFSEHMDLFHFPDAMSQAQKKAWIQRKYAQSQLDLVIAVGNVPTDIFPEVPLLCLSVQLQDNASSCQGSRKNAASLWAELGARKTIEAALRVQPQAREVFVVIGPSPAESVLLDKVQKQIGSYSEQLQITYLTNLGFSEILKRVETLGPESVVLFVAFSRDMDGRLFIAADAASKIAAVSGAPVYVVFDGAVGTGAVGGYVTRFGEMGKQAGKMALQFLAGGHPEDTKARNEYVFDWRQLQRWKISEAALPPGSILINRIPTVWEVYRYYIFAGIVVLLLQTLLILGLLFQRARKRKFQKSLVEQIAFERMLADLSTTFINLPEEQIGATIEQSLRRIAECLNLDRITLFENLPNGAGLRTTLSWHSNQAKLVPAMFRADEFPRMTSLLQNGEAMLISDRDTLPEEFGAEKAYFQESGAISVAAIPLKSGDQRFGAVSFASTRRRVLWTEALVGQLRLLAGIFSNALMRKRALDARFVHAAIVESTDDAVISKDLDGTILSWNSGAQGLFGFSASEAIGQPITIIIPDELRAEEASILQRTGCGEAIDHYETVRVTKAGRKLQVSLTISPLRDSSGKIVGASKIARDITEKKQAEQALRKSEERFRLFMDHSPAVAWMKDEPGRYVYLSESYLKQLGVSMEDRLGKTDLEVYPRAIAEELVKNDRLALDLGRPIEVTEDSIGSKGQPCTWLAYKFPFQDASGQLFVGGIGVDISERKKAEQALHDLTGRLISAQEEERTRIARELHDDFSQRLALLGISLGQLWKKIAPQEVESRASVQEMLKAIKEISSDMHSLSHELHSSKLEHVGLGPALTALCRDIGLKYTVEVQFSQSEASLHIPKDVALCLFRVAQESLANVVKHSRAKTAHVELGGSPSSITLRISDSGIGWDTFSPKNNAGIGLVGMRERLRLVGGTFLVTSQPGRGTEISAEVPLVARENASNVRAKTAER